MTTGLDTAVALRFGHSPFPGYSAPGRVYEQEKFASNKHSEIDSKRMMKMEGKIEDTNHLAAMSAHFENQKLKFKKYRVSSVSGNCF